LGLHLEKGGFLHAVGSLVQHIPQTHLPTLLLAIVMLFLLFGLEHFLPRLPAPLVAVVVGITASAVFGIKAAGVGLVGNIPAGLPVPALPDLSMVSVLWPGALGIALMAFTESIAAGRAFARHGDPRLQPNRELLALGAASLAGSLFSCLCAGGGTSQTAVNVKAGARTQAAELVTVAVAVAALLVLAPLISLLPQATLAAVVVVTTCHC
jgi:MFS superfamily sulfate permease-like transporter